MIKIRQLGRKQNIAFQPGTKQNTTEKKRRWYRQAKCHGTNGDT